MCCIFKCMCWNNWDISASLPPHFFESKYSLCKDIVAFPITQGYETTEEQKASQPVTNINTCSKTLITEKKQ